MHIDEFINAGFRVFFPFLQTSVCLQKNNSGICPFYSKCKLNLALEYQYTYIIGIVAVEPPWGQTFYSISPDYILNARWPDMGWNTFDFHVV